MKKIILTLILSTTHIFALNTIVSILPQLTFVQAIGGDKVNTSLMVQIGVSPHTYEPKPSQMVDISKADIYFAIDVEFEDVWLPKFESINPNMAIVDLADGIAKISSKQEECKGDDHDHHHHAGDDPHIWTSPANVEIIVKNIYKALSKADPSNGEYYRLNLEKYLAKIRYTHHQITAILSVLDNNNKFMVFHPSWGYFARDYNLIQIAVEIEGKKPKAKELINLLKEAKKDKINAIFTQPEFSDSVAKIISKELSIPVIKVTPLAPNWSDNLIKIAKAIANRE